MAAAASAEAGASPNTGAGGRATPDTSAGAGEGAAVPDTRLTFFGAMRQAVSGGTAFGTRKTVPSGRAERLGLAAVSPAASTALTMPFEFLGLGDDRRVGAELAGFSDGLGARVFEFNADEYAGPRGDASGG